MTKYTIGKIRTFTGMEGQGVNAMILKDGKPVAFVLDDATGGEMQIDFTNPGQNPKSYAAHHANARREEVECIAFARDWFANAPEAQEARTFFRELNEQYPQSARAVQSDGGCLRDWINHEIDAAQAKKRLDRIAKTKTLFRVKGEQYQEGEFRTVKAPYSEKVREYLDKKYGDRIEMIYGVSA